MIKSLFDQDIRPELLKLLNGSKKELTAAVAWFTDQSIFSALNLAIARGVKLRLLTQEDEINCMAPFDLGKLAKKGAQIWLWDPAVKGTMHHKFLVVDSRIVMVGSYNWTNYAANRNRENANFFDGTEAPVKDYLEVFDEMCQQARIHPLSPGITGIFHSDAKVKLRVQIRKIEAEISELEAEKTEVQGVIERFTLQVQQRLGYLILKRSEIETELAKRLAEQTKRRSDREKYEQKKEEFEEKFASYERDKDKKIATLTEEEEISIKRMHREAVMIIHPDRFFDQPEMEAKANEMTAKLNEAYKNNDIEAVRQIWQAIKDGTLFGADVFRIDDVNKLEEILKTLEQKLSLLIQELNLLKQEEFYRIGLEPSIWEDYLSKTAAQVVANIDALEKEILILIRNKS